MAPYREYHGDNGVDIEFLNEKEAVVCECCHKEPAEPNGLCTTCNELFIPFISSWISLPTYCQDYINNNPDILKM